MKQVKSHNDVGTNPHLNVLPGPHPERLTFSPKIYNFNHRELAGGIVVTGRFLVWRHQCQRLVDAGNWQKKLENGRAQYRNIGIESGRWERQ